MPDEPTTTAPPQPAAATTTVSPLTAEEIATVRATAEAIEHLTPYPPRPRMPLTPEIILRLLATLAAAVARADDVALDRDCAGRDAQMWREACERERQRADAAEAYLRAAAFGAEDWTPEQCYEHIADVTARMVVQAVTEPDAGIQAARADQARQFWQERFEQSADRVNELAADLARSEAHRARLDAEVSRLRRWLAYAQESMTYPGVSDDLIEVLEGENLGNPPDDDEPPAAAEEGQAFKGGLAKPVTFIGPAAAGTATGDGPPFAEPAAAPDQAAPVQDQESR